MRRALALLCAAALSACAGGGMDSHSAVPAVPDSGARSSQAGATLQSASGTIWNVGTGASTYSYALQDLDFFPNAITIDAGDSITYHIGSGVGGDAHTVSFVPAGQKIPPPNAASNVVPAGGNTIDGTTFVNSGILTGGQNFTLHFTKAGTYKILCLFHEPAMVSTVVVQAAGARYPHTAQYYLNLGADDEWEDLGEAQRSLASFPFPSGGNTIAAGIDPGLVHFPPPDSTVLRFINSSDTTSTVVAREGNKTIKIGTVLTFVNETSNEPHTVTFALAGQSALPNIPTDPAVNVVPPPGITVVDGTHVVNSGTIVGGQKFMVKFAKPGTYFYGCLYHDNSRMTGVITVTK